MFSFSFPSLRSSAVRGLFAFELITKQRSTAGGVTNGNDLVAAYARTSGRFPGPVAELGLLMTETGDRPQLYETGKAAMTLGVVWQILKAVFMGFGKKKTA